MKFISTSEGVGFRVVMFDEASNAASHFSTSGVGRNLISAALHFRRGIL